MDDAIRFVSEHGKSGDEMNYQKDVEEEEKKMTNKVF